MTQVIIRPGESDEETVSQTAGWEWKREIGKMDKLTISVPRSFLDGVEFTLKEDVVELDGVAAGRLVNVERGGSAWRLIVYSFDWDAHKVSPTLGGDLREGTDKEIITSLIDDADVWTVGSIDELTGPMSFVLNHSLIGEALRRVERNVPGELRWNDDASVDYVANLGSDKTNTVTLSPDQGNIEGEIRITSQGRDMDHTHLRVIGAHEGEAQIFANLVPESDPATHPNEVRYQTSRWDGPEDTDWGRWENKDVSDRATIEEEAAALGDELKERLVEARATVVGEDVSLGDLVHVEKPDADASRDMRIHRIRTKSRGATVRHEVQLSTRTVARSDEANRIRDIQRYNVSWEGASVALTGGPVIAAVDDGNPLEIPFRYPDLEYENNAEVHVKGLEYRIDSEGAAAGAGSFVTSADNSDATNTVGTSSSGGGQGWQGRTMGEVTLDQITVSSSTNTSELYAFAAMKLHSIDSISSFEVDVWLENSTNGTIYPSSKSFYAFEEGDTRAFWAVEASNVAGENLRLKAEEASNSDGGSFGSVTGWFAAGLHNHEVEVSEHTHEPLPGIFETDDTPSNVDLLVNGVAVETDIGSGTFETVIDISGELDPGEWNTVTVMSDSLGRVMVTPFIEGYDQIGMDS